MSKLGRPRKENAKRKFLNARYDNMHERMLKYITKEKQTSISDYLRDAIERDYMNTKGFRKGRPFYCVETNEVFSLGKECCEQYGITLNELNDCLHKGVSVNGYTFKFIL